MQRNSEIIEQLKQTLLIFEENQKILEIGEQNEGETNDEYVKRIDCWVAIMEENGKLSLCDDNKIDRILFLRGLLIKYTPYSIYCFAVRCKQSLWYRAGLLKKKIKTFITK